MLKKLLGLAVLCIGLSACSSDPLDSGEQVEQPEVTGSLGLSLVSETPSATYRLVNATFTISGATLKKPRFFNTGKDPIETVHVESLARGSYSILLEPGWTLERKDRGSTAFQTVNAQLMIKNPVGFEITRDQATNITFSFATDAGAVDLGTNKLNVSIGVSDCSMYDQYAAAIATFTVDCTGTIDDKSFWVDPRGMLRRRFEKCANGDESLIRSIDDLIGLQFRFEKAPFAQQCIAGRWEAWRRKFEGSNIVACPTWKHTGTVVNAPTPALIDTIIPQLPKLPAREDGKRPSVIANMKTSNQYSLSFATEPPAQGCASPSACATACAGGFQSFVIKADSATTILTDPTYWLLDKLYPSPADDPFMKPGYYHPMSYYGVLPGAIFGHRNRKGENCSRYEGGMHYIFQLQEDCLDTGDLLSCVSECVP